MLGIFVIIHTTIDVCGTTIKKQYIEQCDGTEEQMKGNIVRSNQNNGAPGDFNVKHVALVIVCQS